MNQSSRPQSLFRRLGRLAGCALLSVLSVPAVSAQTAPPPVDPEVIQLETFVVESIAEGQARAVNQQRSANTIKNIVSADAIGNLPDRTIGEALGRLPGVNVVDDSYASIRGTAAEFNAVTLDGDRFTSSGDSVDSTQTQTDTRAVDLSLIPSEMVGGIEVIKALTADMDADSFGGTINLVTRSAFDLKERSINGKFEYLHNDFRSKDGWAGSLTYMDVLNEARTVGLSATLSYRKEDRWTNSYEFSYYDDGGIPVGTSGSGTAGAIAAVGPAITSAMVARLNNSYAPETTKSKAAIGQWEMFSRRVILTGGIRQDDITSKNFLFNVMPVTLINGGKGQGTFAPATTTSVTNKNVGVVVKVTKWLDAFANKSTNTVAAAGSAYNIYNESLPVQEGDGYDLGLRGFFLDDRVILKINYFHNVADNRVSNPLRDGAIGIEMARLNGYVERYLEGMVLNGQSAKVAGAKRFNEYQTSNGLWTDLESDASKGYEVEVTLNPTKQLRLMCNVSYNDATLNATYKFTRPWYDKYVLPFRNDAALSSLIANPAFNATRTIGEYMAGMERRLNYHEAQVGGSRIRGNNWLVNLVGSYAWDQGPLKGTRVGGSARWRDAPSIGYPEVAGTFDVKNAFKGAESLVTDAFVSYSWKSKLHDQNTNWSVSLRVRNLLNHDEYYPNNAVDYGNGVPHILQKMYVQPRSYELTAGMKF